MRIGWGLGLSIIVVLLVGIGCGGSAAVETAAVTALPNIEMELPAPTTTPTPMRSPTQTPTTDPYNAALADLGMHPCQMVPPDSMPGQLVSLIGGDPVEQSEIAADGSVTGVCTYQKAFVLTVFIPGSEVDLAASYQSTIPENHIEVDRRPPDRLWGRDNDTLYYLDDALWISIQMLQSDQDNLLLDAVDLYNVVITHIPVDPSIPTATPQPTGVPVEYVNPCVLVSVEEAEAIIGPVGFPSDNGIYSPRAGTTLTCFFYSDLNSLIVDLIIYDTANNAQDAYDVLMDNSDDPELVADVGQTTFQTEGPVGEAQLTSLYEQYILRLRLELHDQSADPQSLLQVLIGPALDRLENPPPTPTPLPTAIPYEACELISQEESEAIIGPWTSPPEATGSVGEGDNEVEAIYTRDCIYSGETAWVYLTTMQGNTADHARALYAQLREGTEYEIQTVSGLGDAAYYYQQDEFRGTVVVWNGRFVFSLLMDDFDQEPLQRAVDMATVIVGNLP